MSKNEQREIEKLNVLWNLPKYDSQTNKKAHNIASDLLAGLIV